VIHELEEYRRQCEAREKEAAHLVAGLSVKQLAWREGPRTWSVAECLNHLNVAGNASVSGIRAALVDARARGLLADGPFRHSLIGRCFIRLMDAPPRIRFSAPKAYRPAWDLPAPEIIEGFVRLQRDLVRVLEDADGIDLARVKVRNPVSNRFRMSLGQEFALTAAHERRHLWRPVACGSFAKRPDA
jgi:hypothetical protein